ncbi:MAG: acyl-ACP desaturase [Kofleriaceae bacterium]
MNRTDLLHELAPVAATLFDRHRSATREWFPHEHIPYHRARDFAPGETWSPGDADCGGVALTEAARSALFVNVLTEDNLPYYFHDIERMFGTDEVWGEWARWWTAEEGRHAIVLRDYLTVTRAVDLRELERARMRQVSGGEAPAPPGPHHGFVYLCLQELATRISHRNTGAQVGDPVAKDVMARVAFDENLHYLFYRDLTTAALAVDPSTMILAMADVVTQFKMPGTGIPDFARHSAIIAKAGIYDLGIHHDQILVPIVLRHWNIAALTGLTDEAERARDRLLAYVARLGRVAARLATRGAAPAPTALAS